MLQESEEISAVRYTNLNGIILKKSVKGCHTGERSPEAPPLGGDCLHRPWGLEPIQVNYINISIYLSIYISIFLSLDLSIY